MALSLGRYANDKPRYCDFLVRGKKDAGQKGKSIKFDYTPDPSDPTQLSKYRATYNVALKVRLRGVTAVLRRLGGSTAAASEE
jgi:hypothetical protein